MKTLILCESLRINKTSSGIVSSTFIKSLENNNFDITCLYEDSIPLEQITWFSTVNLIPVTYAPKKQNLLQRIPKIKAIPSYLRGYSNSFKNCIDDWIEIINKTLENESFDLIITLGSGAGFIPHYAMKEIKTHIPWIANFHDPYPMTLYPEPYREKSNIIYKIQERHTKEIISKASFVTFPSKLLMDEMSSYFPLIKDKGFVLPHVGMELSHTPSEDDDNLVNFQLNRFNLVHAGNLMKYRKIEYLLRAYKRFIESDSEIKKNSVLNILGFIKKEQKHYVDMHLNSDNVKIISHRVSYKKSIALTKQADVSIIIEAIADTSPFMPGKLADLIYQEKQILALTPKKSETLRILGEDYEFSSRVDDEDKIYELLVKLYALWKKDKLKLSNAARLKAYISEKHLSETITKKLRE